MRAKSLVLLPFLLAAVCSSCSGSSDSGASVQSIAGEPLAYGPFPYGFVDVLVDKIGYPGTPSGATARFMTADPNPRCGFTGYGACVVTSCASPSIATGAGQSAGDIGVSGAAVPMKLSPDSDNSYSAVSNDPFAGGETITVDAAGGEVPAFEGIVTAPAPINASAFPADGSSVDSSKDLTLAWQGGGAGFVSVRLAAVKVGGPEQDIWCIAPASAASLVVPSAALRAIAGSTAIVGLNVYSRHRVKAGAWTIDVRAMRVDKSIGGNPFISVKVN